MESFHTNQPVEILIVDDEPQAVKYFKKAFGTKYQVLTATSADEAESLVLSGNHNIGLVITDQRMPGRSGVSLLNRIRNERPDIIRMLTTAYSDLDSAIDAVNKGEILRYISKPWDLRVLEAEIEQAITFFLLKNEYDLLLRDKLSALHRTLLRDRVNDMAFMAGMLPYNNAPLTMYNYLKDALAESAWRSSVQRQWSQLRTQDHWRIPVEEAHRNINLSEELMSKPLVMSAQCKRRDRPRRADQRLRSDGEQRDRLAADQCRRRFRAHRHSGRRAGHARHHAAAPGAHEPMGGGRQHAAGQHQQRAPRGRGQRRANPFRGAQLRAGKSHAGLRTIRTRAAGRAEARQRIPQGVPRHRTHGRHDQLAADGERLQADPRHLARHGQKGHQECSARSRSSGSRI